MAISPQNKDLSPAERALAFAVETRKFEIERFWQRSLFFWGFIAAAGIAYCSETLRNEPAQLVVACFGAMCSLAWTLSNRGSKYWQEAWETKVERLEQEVLGLRLFSRIEPPKNMGWWGGSRFSVSRLAIALSDFTLIVWLAAAASLAHIDPAGRVDGWRAGVIGISALYGFAMVAWTRTTSAGQVEAG